MCFKKNAKYVFQQQSPVGLAASVIVTIINIVVAVVVSGGGGGDGGVYACCHDVHVEIIGQLLVLFSLPQVMGIKGTRAIGLL